ncbi:MAG TPA: hypothetical protein VIO11_07380, partial [Candidatus Methanoperedens sp.]
MKINKIVVIIVAFLLMCLSLSTAINNFDLDRNGIVDMRDLAIAWHQFGGTASAYTPATANPYIYQIYSNNGNIYAKDQNGIIRYSGTKPSPVIQSALDNAKNGGEILVKKGTYTDDKWNLQIYNENIKLSGEKGTIFKVSPGKEIHQFIYINTNNAAVDGFELNGLKARMSNGIYVVSNGNISNIIIKNIKAGNIGSKGTDAAITVEGYNAINNMMIKNIQISDSILTNNYRGITILGSGFSTIYGVTIKNISVKNSIEDGISIWGTKVLTLRDITSNSSGRHGITISAEHFNTDNLQAYNNKNSGIVITEYAKYGVMNNTITMYNTWHGINIDTTLSGGLAADAYLTINGGTGYKSTLYHGLYINGANHVTVNGLVL